MRTVVKLAVVLLAAYVLLSAIHGYYFLWFNRNVPVAWTEWIGLGPGNPDGLSWDDERLESNRNTKFLGIETRYK